jgi:homoserine acetyltransferase
MHYLSDQGVDIILKCKIPILVTIAEADQVMPPHLQLELAKVLKAEKKYQKGDTWEIIKGFRTSVMQLFLILGKFDI